MAVPVPSRANETIAAVLRLSRPVPTVLAVGTFLKNTLCLTQDREAWLSQDVGNLETVEAVHLFEGYAERLLRAAEAAPVAVAHDLHPNFHSTRYANALALRLGIETAAVQHHHAHTAAVMAEHGIEEPVLGLALDGFGLGENDESWGGELLLVEPSGYRRLGHLASLKQPGADKAAREPWRMGAAALHALDRTDEIAKRFGQIHGAEVIARMLERNINCPPTTSCGRLFDAACGLLEIKPFAAFEGEAPMELERMATQPIADPQGWKLEHGILDMTPLLGHLIGRDAKTGAGLFHGTLIAAMADWVAWATETTGIRRVALAGGCFLNRVLNTGLISRLEERGIEPITSRALRPGDAAISLGQAWVVAMAKG